MTGIPRSAAAHPRAGSTSRARSSRARNGWARSGRARNGWAARVVAVLVGLLLVGCSVVSPSAAPTWVPKPEGPPPGDLPIPQQPGDSTPSGGTGGSGGTQPSPGQPGDPNVVATGLTLPWGLTLLPDGSALVGERTTGKILRVQPRRAPVHTVMRIPGVDASGDGGLLDLALSPGYAEDGLVFAYLTTHGDNRIVRFTLGGKVTPVLTGIPRGGTDNGGRLAFDSDGLLYVGTGDAGHPKLAADPKSLAGKVLRMTSFGRPAADNPDPTSLVFSRGHRNVTGLCLDGSDRVYTAEPGSSANSDEVNQVKGGGDYGWPGGGKAATPPAISLDAAATGPGGCAVIERGLFVTALRGQRLWAVPLDQNGRPGEPESLLTKAYGRLRTVVAAPDGALWLTTSNKDSAGKPTKEDDRVIRIIPPTGTTNSPA